MRYISGMDLTTTAREIGISLDSYKRLCKIFIAHTTEDMKELKKAIKEHRLAEAADLAHHIKGAAANMEFNDMADAAKELQLHTLDSSVTLPELLSSYDKLDELYQSIKIEIEAEL